MCINLYIHQLVQNFSLAPGTNKNNQKPFWGPLSLAVLPMYFAAPFPVMLCIYHHITQKSTWLVTLLWLAILHCLGRLGRKILGKVTCIRKKPFKKSQTSEIYVSVDLRDKSISIKDGQLVTLNSICCHWWKTQCTKPGLYIGCKAVYRNTMWDKIIHFFFIKISQGCFNFNFCLKVKINKYKENENRWTETIKRQTQYCWSRRRESL